MGSAPAIVPIQWLVRCLVYSGCEVTIKFATPIPKYTYKHNSSMRNIILIVTTRFQL